MKTKYFLNSVLALFFATSALNADDCGFDDPCPMPETIPSPIVPNEGKCQSSSASSEGEDGDKDELCIDENQIPDADSIAYFFQGHEFRGPKIQLAKPISRKTMQKKVIPKVVSGSSKSKPARPLKDASYCDIPKRIAVNQRALSVRISFELGTDRLTPQAQAQLKPIGEGLQNKKLYGKKIIIEGHTDASGACDYNAELSKKRAMAVKAFLITEYKLTNPIEAIGEGEFSLLDKKNPTAAINRRVRIAMEKPANTAFSESLPLARNP